MSTKKFNSLHHLIVLLVGLCLFAACKNAVQPIRVTSAEQPQATAESSTATTDDTLTEVSDVTDHEAVVEKDQPQPESFPLQQYEHPDQVYTIAYPEGWEVNEPALKATTFVNPGSSIMVVMFDEAELMFEGKPLPTIMETFAADLLDAIFLVDDPTFIDEQIISETRASVTATFDMETGETFTANVFFDQQGDIGLVTLFATNNYAELAPMWQTILAEHYQLNPEAAKQVLAPVKLPIYSVGEYDPTRDPAADLAAAVTEAQASNRRALLVIGGDWCITCHQLDRFYQQNPAVAQAMEDNFVMVKVNYSEDNRNEAFLDQYPDFEWVPHFYIFDEDGSLLHSYDTRALETDGLHNGAKIMAFVEEWGTQNSVEPDPIYLTTTYDPTRDPYTDLTQAITRATKSNKHILLEIGGEWCVWCHILDDYIQETPDVAEALQKNYIVVKVNFSEENTNEEFIAQYPAVGGYPHIYVLDQKGNLLHSQDTVELEEGESYSDEAFLAFLARWSPQ